MKKFCSTLLFLSTTLVAMQNQTYEEYQSNRKKLFSCSRTEAGLIDNHPIPQSIAIVKLRIPIPQAQAEHTTSRERAYLSSQIQRLNNLHNTAQDLEYADIEVFPEIITKATTASRNICFLMRTIEINPFLEQFNEKLSNLQDEEKRGGTVMIDPAFISKTIQDLATITEAFKDSFFAPPY